MERNRIQWIWILSLVAGCAIIGLQGYWLFNQYRYNTVQTAEELETKVYATWDKYKNQQKSNSKDKQSYNSNLNQHSILFSHQDELTSLTQWDIVLTFGPDFLVSSPSSETTWSDEKKTEMLKEISLLMEKADNLETTKEQQTSDDASATRHDEEISRDSILQKIHELKHQPWTVETEHRDSLIIKKFGLITGEKKEVVYDAVDMYTRFRKHPFRKSELDSLITAATQIPTMQTDTTTLPPDSVLWAPKSVCSSKLVSPTLTIAIPYNILEKKVVNLTIPIPPNKILENMFWQILITLLLIILLGTAIAIQIKVIAEQMRINQLRQNFVNTTVHELKRPVQTLKAIVAFLQNEESESGQMLDDARRETDNLTAYLQKLQEVNDGENISDSIHLTHFDFTPLVLECTDAIRRNTPKPLHIYFRLPEEKAMVIADRMAMGNVIINILENAVKYSGDKPDLKIRIEVNARTLRLSISDNGFGIPRSEQGKIFKPFYRVTNGQTGTLPGMGLGLSYVKMIVDAHNGRITVDSELNKGTTISIELPL